MDPAVQRRSIAEDASVSDNVGAVIVASDDDGDISSFTITAGNDAGKFSVSSSGQITVAAALDFETVESYNLTIVVEDAASNTFTGYVEVEVTDVNDAPTMSDASASVAEMASAGTSVPYTLVSDANDAGQTLSYSITGGNTGTAFEIDADTGALSVADPPILDYETKSSYSLEITVTDDGSPVKTGTATLTVSITDVNDVPVFGTLPSWSVTENSAVSTVVSGGDITATDEDSGQSISYAITGGNTGTVFALDSSSGQLSVAVAALDYETKSSYTLTITATDDGLSPQSASTDVTVTIVDENDAPTMSDASASVAEDAADGASVSYTLVSNANDAGQTLSYAITGGDTDSAFVMNSGTGALSLANPSVLDYETTTSYSLEVTVTDDGSPAKTGTATITVTVTDVNDAPTMSDASASVAEDAADGASVSYTLVSNANDAGQTLSYAITGGDTDSAFVMNSGTGALSLANPSVLDYETTTSYSLEVTVTDDGSPAKAGTATITVAVVDVNEVPTATSRAVTINEHFSLSTTIVGANIDGQDQDAGDVLSYEITAGNDDGLFQINTATGDISLAKSVNFELATTHTLTVVVSDDDASPLSATATVTVTVTDENDLPVFTGDNPRRTINEHQPVDTVVFGGKVNATDEDVGQSISFSIIAGNDDDAFKIDATTGDIAVKTDVLNHEAQSSYTLTVQVTDDNTPTAGTATLDVVVDVIDINEGPSISDATGSVDELSSSGDTVSVSLTAVDVDRDEVLSFSIVGGNSFSAFAIDPVTSVITVDNTTAVDYEIFTSFSLTVRASDDGTPPLHDDATVTINVVDKNDQPRIMNPQDSASVDENVADGTFVLAMDAKDLDATPVQVRMPFVCVCVPAPACEDCFHRVPMPACGCCWLLPLVCASRRGLCHRRCHGPSRTAIRKAPLRLTLPRVTSQSLPRASTTKAPTRLRLRSKSKTTARQPRRTPPRCPSPSMTSTTCPCCRTKLVM